MITASAPGKCILLGEHAVVYGQPAMAMAINMHSFCTIIDTKKEFELIFPDEAYTCTISNPRKNLNRISKTYNQFRNILSIFQSKYHIDLDRISIRIESELSSGSGLGSSASTAIAFLCAINNKFDLDLDAEKINHYGLEMEKWVHGTPSGIDNSICTYGGIIVFQNGIREKLIPPKFPILITNSGQIHNTGNVIKNLRKKSLSINELFKDIGQIVEEGVLAIKSKNFIKLGDIFNQNQSILAKLGLSTAKIDEIISISTKNGAYGAKLTGAGAGGSVITIGELNDLQKIQLLLQNQGYASNICYSDNGGMKIESK
jgi:mevalonate kinase